MLILKLVFIANIYLFAQGDELPTDCKNILGQKLIDEIASYAHVRDKILNHVLEGEFKGTIYTENTILSYKLAKFIDKFGPRPSGSETLERSIDYMIDLTHQYGIHDNITTEDVKVPKWTRGKEEITMLKPRERKISVIGLGNSVSTPKEGITAQVLVVDSFDEFKYIPEKDVAGKIVLFNANFVDYPDTVEYRYQAASRAAKKGAVASLVKSITNFSIYSPHTGIQIYENGTKKIPTAAISLEDANFLKRLYIANEVIELNIKMFSTLEYTISRNTLIDLKGSKNPEKLVIVSGHIDSWDNGDGAMDDGGGLFISWAVPVLLKMMDMQPRRTIRTIFWTAEEQYYVGAYAYQKRHEAEEKNINFMMESDDGTFKPQGLMMIGSEKAICIVAEVLKLFEKIHATNLTSDFRSATDIDLFLQKRNIPGAGLLVDKRRYYWFHHSSGDTMDVEDTQSLDLCTAFWTTVTFIIADLSVDIPRKNITVEHK